jgi:diaminohydroxyphosphoribosylaminopyrimidine deaminase / 5-amino-6-(5-phosphoribosylamino)uracil reductase
METDSLYMRRALELAELGRGSVSPNPMVGCVIVHDGEIIGEGFHRQYGGPHAEPNAINAVNQPEMLQNATVYVTLEPCAHWGKTPPCALLLIEKKVKKVVIAAVDSNPLVGGKGISLLKEAGIDVVTGVLEAEARQQNKRFFTVMEKKRPYIILKWAQTRDGFLARENFDSKWISNVYSRQLVHKWRSEEDGIMVGTLTARYDNPRLNVRDWEGKNPVRIVLDRNLSLDEDLHLFDRSQLTLRYNEKVQDQMPNLEAVLLRKGFDLEDVLKDLHQRKINSVFVEGGAQLLQKFIAAELWDEARVFTGNTLFGAGIPAPVPKGIILDEIEVMGDKLVYWEAAPAQSY